MAYKIIELDGYLEPFSEAIDARMENYKQTTVSTRSPTAGYTASGRLPPRICTFVVILTTGICILTKWRN